MLFFIWFDFVKGNCADRCLLWEKHAELMESYYFLILHEALLLVGLLLSKVFLFLVCTWSDIRLHVTHTFMDERVMEAGIR